VIFFDSSRNSRVFAVEHASSSWTVEQFAPRLRTNASARRTKFAFDRVSARTNGSERNVQGAKQAGTEDSADFDRLGKKKYFLEIFLSFPLAVDYIVPHELNRRIALRADIA
jgi:hypothetical protein